MFESLLTKTPKIYEGKIILSLAAGITISQLSQWLPKSRFK